MTLPPSTSPVNTKLPTPLSDRLQITYADVVAFCKRWHIRELALFGSVLRNDFRPDSDIDVLVVFDPDVPRNPFHRSQAQAALATLFSRDVDLTEKALLINPVSQQHILHNHYVIYPAPASALFKLQTIPMADQQKLRDAAAITDMIRAIQEIQEDTSGLTYETYQTQRTIRRAVERNCEIIGEAARRISPACRAAHADVDWSGAVGFRNVIIHQYDQVNDREVWTIVSSMLPTLLTQLESLLPELSGES